MPILKRIKEEATRTARGFSRTTGIGLAPSEKKKWKAAKYERDIESQKRTVEVLKRQAEVETLRARIRKARQAGRPMTRKTYRASDWNPFMEQQPTAAKKTTKKKRTKKKSKKKRRRVTEYY